MMKEKDFTSFNLTYQLIRKGQAVEAMGKIITACLFKVFSVNKSLPIHLIWKIERSDCPHPLIKLLSLFMRLLLKKL